MNKVKNLIDAVNSSTPNEIYDALLILGQEDVEKLIGIKYLICSAIKIYSLGNVRNV